MLASNTATIDTTPYFCSYLDVQRSGGKKSRVMIEPRFPSCAAERPPGRAALRVEERDEGCRLAGEKGREEKKRGPVP